VPTSLASIGLIGFLLAPFLLAEGEPRSEPAMLALSEFAVTVSEGIDWSRPLQVALEVDDPEGLRSSLYGDPASDSEGGRVEQGSVIVPLDVLPPIPVDAPQDRHRNASFLIDFDEPAVAGLVSEIRARHGPDPTLDQLMRAAGDAIPRKSRTRGWDAASVVVKFGEGDCTEHAVVLAALARAYGHPARVALGTVLILEDGRARAFGHAWTEIHDGEAWRRFDATRPPERLGIYYLRTGELENEGTAHMMAIFQTMSRSVARRIELSNVAGAP